MEGKGGLLGVLVVGVAAFIGLSLTIGLHSDDLRILSDAADSSYADLWTSPFLDRFYRPLVVTLVRLSSDAFGPSALPLRILQGLLIAASIYTLATMFEGRVARPASYTAALFLLASPLTFVSISPFAVGIGDLVVGLMFLLAVRSTATAPLVAFTALALLSKESGLLVAAYCAFESGRRRRHVVCAAICALVLGYLYMRTHLATLESFEFATGFFFEMRSAEELDRTFGHSPGPLYVYNVIANLLNALVGFPEKGHLRLHAQSALLIPATTATTIIVVRYLTLQRQWQAMAPFVGLVVLNAVIGYAYVRSRIMFVGAFSMSLLVLFAIDDLLTRPQRAFGLDGRRLALVVACIWACVLVHSLVRLGIQSAASS